MEASEVPDNQYSEELTLSLSKKYKRNSSGSDDDRELGKAAQRYASVDGEGNATEDYDDLQRIESRISINDSQLSLSYGVKV